MLNSCISCSYAPRAGTMTKDMWAHQYLQQANEINAMHTDPHVFYTDGDDSTIYGLQPNYGCCTANFNQGWPKFAQRMIKGVNSNGGVAVAMWGPVAATVPLSGECSVVLACAFLVGCRTSSALAQVRREMIMGVMALHSLDTCPRSRACIMLCEMEHRSQRLMVVPIHCLVLSCFVV